MLLHAEGLSPVRVATGACVVVAAFWAYYAEVAGGELLEAGVAVALAVTLAGFIATANAGDGAGPGERDVGADMGVEVEAFVIQFQVVVDGVVSFDEHFS